MQVNEENFEKVPNDSKDNHKHCSKKAHSRGVNEHQAEQWFSYGHGHKTQKFTKFSDLVKIRDVDIPKVVQYFTWDNDDYRDFMMRLLDKLKPRFQNSGDILVYENDEVNEVIFISSGRVDIGY